METGAMEQTLVLIKPDALKNSLTGYLLSQLSEYHTGLRLSAAKIVNVNKMLAEEHYAEHKAKAFFPSLIDYISGALHYPDDPGKRRVVAFVYQGEGAIGKIRAIAGPTSPLKARQEKPGTIRALGSLIPVQDETGTTIDERMDNLIHASANDADAEREIKLWFRPDDIPPLMRTFPTEISGEHYYFKNSKLHTTHEPDSVCIVAPGDLVWKSDLETLRSLYQGVPASSTLEAVTAKYLINR